MLALLSCENGFLFISPNFNLLNFKSPNSCGSAVCSLSAWSHAPYSPGCRMRGCVPECRPGDRRDADQWKLPSKGQMPTMAGRNAGWGFMDVSPLWRFAPWMIRPLRRFAAWTFRPHAMDDSPPMGGEQHFLSLETKLQSLFLWVRHTCTQVSQLINNDFAFRPTLSEAKICQLLVDDVAAADNDAAADIGL